MTRHQLMRVGVRPLCDDSIRLFIIDTGQTGQIGFRCLVEIHRFFPTQSLFNAFCDRFGIPFDRSGIFGCFLSDLIRSCVGTATDG